MYIFSPLTESLRTRIRIRFKFTDIIKSSDQKPGSQIFIMKDKLENVKNLISQLEVEYERVGVNVSTILSLLSKIHIQLTSYNQKLCSNERETRRLRLVINIVKTAMRILTTGGRLRQIQFTILILQRQKPDITNCNKNYYYY